MKEAKNYFSGSLIGVIFSLIGLLIIVTAYKLIGRKPDPFESGMVVWASTVISMMSGILTMKIE